MRSSLRRLTLLLLCCAVATGQSNVPVKTAVRMGVFGLFHPRALVVSPAPSGAIEITFDKQLLRIASDSPDPQLRIRMLAGELELSIGRGSSTLSIFRSRAMMLVQLNSF